jgi:hypothetical protein
MQLLQLWIIQDLFSFAKAVNAVNDNAIAIATADK